MSNQRSQIEQDERVKEWKNERYQKRRGEKSSSHALKEPQTIQNLCICFEIRSTKIEIRTSVRFNAEWTDPLDNLRRMKEAILKRYEQNPRCCPAKDSPLEPDVTRQSHEHETYEEDVQLGRGNRCCGVESFWTNELLHFRIHNSTNLQKNERVHRVKNQVWQSDDNRRTVSHENQISTARQLAVQGWLGPISLVEGHYREIQTYNSHGNCHYVWLKSKSCRPK
jgi:hypothetical protein